MTYPSEMDDKAERDAHAELARLWLKAETVEECMMKKDLAGIKIKNSKLADEFLMFYWLKESGLRKFKTASLSLLAVSAVGMVLGIGPLFACGLSALKTCTLCIGLPGIAGMLIAKAAGEVLANVACGKCSDSMVAADEPHRFSFDWGMER